MHQVYEPSEKEKMKKIIILKNPESKEIRHRNILQACIEKLKKITLPTG